MTSLLQGWTIFLLVKKVINHVFIAIQCLTLFNYLKHDTPVKQNSGLLYFLVCFHSQLNGIAHQENSSVISASCLVCVGTCVLSLTTLASPLQHLRVTPVLLLDLSSTASLGLSIKLPCQLAECRWEWIPASDQMSKPKQLKKQDGLEMFFKIKGPEGQQDGSSQIISQVPHMVPQVLPGMIPKHRQLCPPQKWNFVMYNLDLTKAFSMHEHLFYKPYSCSLIIGRIRKYYFCWGPHPVLLRPYPSSALRIYSQQVRGPDGMPGLNPG